MDPDHPCRRADDHPSVVRVAGYTGRQLALQVLAGVLIAAAVGAMSAWGAQQVIGERLSFLTREVLQLRGEVQEMRRDLYRPRYGRSALWAYGAGGPPPGRMLGGQRRGGGAAPTGVAPLPPGRP